MSSDMTLLLDNIRVRICVILKRDLQWLFDVEWFGIYNSLLACQRSTNLFNNVTRTLPSVGRRTFLCSITVQNYFRGPQKSDLLELLTQIRQGKLSSSIFVRLERLQVHRIFSTNIYIYLYSHPSLDGNLNCLYRTFGFSAQIRISRGWLGDRRSGRT